MVETSFGLDTRQKIGDSRRIANKTAGGISTTTGISDQTDSGIPTTPIQPRHRMPTLPRPNSLPLTNLNSDST
jgi:hypothetical protein